ncbi:MAG TPA: methylmalonyl-CoA mutase family protein, partial [Nitrosopumilus sp.]|nr:methylmalonyl-CoA mutase family protein [Nitrosopumilus sp.]HJO32278.1 methylmalonyl-CoA mutase family protein [Nitrosopumilus sp.]
MAEKDTKSEKEIFTDSNFRVKRIYQKSAKKKPTEDAGKFPFTRGIHPGMYRQRFWTMRQYSGFGDAK